MDEFIYKNKKRLTKHVYLYTALKDLKEKPTYDETYKDEYLAGLKKGKARVLKLDLIRGTNIEDILKKDERMLEWWKNI